MAANPERTRSKDKQAAWERKAEAAVIYRGMYGQEDDWRRYRGYMNHEFFDAAVKSDQPVVNILAARARSIAPKLAVGNPNFTVKSKFAPPSPNSEPALAAALDLVWNTEQFDTELKRSTDDYALFGPGVMFVGYEMSVNDEVISRHRRLFGMLPTEATDKLSEVMPNIVDKFSTTQTDAIQRMLGERAFGERVSPFNFAMDPAAEHWTHALNMQRRIFISEKDAKVLLGNRAPKATSVANVAIWEGMGDGHVSTENTDLMSMMPEAVYRVILWEFWDILEKRTVYLDNEFKYLDDFEWRSAHPGWPFTIITWDDVPDSVWPVGLGKAIEPQMLAINGLRAREYSAAGTGIRKYLTSDNLSMDAKDALMSTEDGTIVEVTQAQFNQVKQLAPASYPPQWDALEERMRRGIDETTHTTEYDTGSAPEIRRTATESAYIQNSSDAMTAFRQQQVERMVSDIGEKILAIVLSVWDKPIPIQIQNRDPLLMINDVYGPREAEIGELIEFDFVGIDHAGLYSVSTEPGSLVAQAKELERSQAMQMYDKFLANPRFASDKFMSFVMSTFPSIQNPQDFILSDDEVAEEAQKAAEAQAQSAPQRAPQAPSGMGPETPGELAASELGAIAPGVG